LKDGAFDFLLSMSADVKPIEWLDPARHGLRQWLQRKSPPLLPDTVTFSNYLQLLLMEQLETFIDAFITHMPDVLRKLRIDEDEQRQLSLTHEHDLDLERFLVIISFAFEGRPDAAQAFWTDPDSNLAGFLHWASRRTTTPLLSAFCEMLQSLAEDEICASKAHEFLLGERTSSSSGKMIRSHSLTWDKIFRELTFYSSNVRERPVMPQSSFFRGKQSHEQAEAEPESAMMLESYLRLMTRLCTESAAARSFLLEHATFSIIDMLYQLASSENVSTRLRACVFTTLRSLLSHKTKERSDFIWKSLDAWVSGDSVATSLVPRNPLAGVAPSSVMDCMLHRLGAGYEECNAFIQLLQTLVAPSEDDAGSDDSLPFPESLGSSNRMPGIDPYVDFVGQVFRARPAEINDPVQFRLLCLTCLEFFNTCLATFNEDLVIFANQSNVAIDRAIGASDLASYVRLHPFARVMEWVFNDGVMSALFSALHQDVAELGNASSDSPLVLSLLRAIQVVNLVMDLQATYMDVVRPLIKLQPTHRRNPVANAAYATFEDGVLNNLSVIADLGLYCGSGHSALIIASLKLLETLSASSKLVGGITPILGRYSGRNKAIAALEANNDAERISRCLVNEISTNLELDEGPGSDAYLIKMHILDFILACLEAMPDIPSIAHLLLGFRCGTDAIDISTEGSFAEGNSLFHGILAIAADYPLRDQACGILSWAVALKYKAVQIMKALWRSPLSSELVMSELRNSDFITGLLSKEVVVNPSTMWDGRILDDSVFLLSSSSYALFDFVRHRASTLQYTALEFRRLTQGTSSTLRERILAAVEGHSSNLDGQQLEMPSIFDLFDFMELETQTYAMAPELFYFKDLDLSVCLEDSRSEPVTYNPRKVRELLALRCNEVRKSGYLTTPKEKLACDQEADEILRFIEIENQNGRLAAARLAALESWTHVMLMIIRTGVLEGSRRTSFVVQTVQTILPKFEKCSVEKLEEAKPLADLAKHLLFSLSFDAQSFQKGEISETASDRLFQLFRVCLRAVYSPIADSQLKETLYGICYRYLTGMSDAFETSSVLRKHSTSTIRSAGERFMDVICDDAYVGDRTCRISALLLLGSLVTLGIHENSNYVLEAFVRLNITGLMVDSIKNIVSELQVCEKDGKLQSTYLPHTRD
jgi:nuclear pore complex protein Nup205